MRLWREHLAATARSAAVFLLLGQLQGEVLQRRESGTHNHTPPPRSHTRHFGSITYPDGATLWAPQWNRFTHRLRVFCVPVGRISLRIPALGVQYDGCVKLAPGGGVAFSGSGHLVYGDGDT